jgi:signal transduction histidine kinase
MNRSRVGLRALMTMATIALAVMAVGVSTGLVLLTTKLHAASNVLRDSVASVRLAQEAEVDLLVLDRSTDDVLRAGAENELRRRLDEAHEHINSATERQALEAATGAVMQYLDGAHDPTISQRERTRRLQNSYAALERLVDFNVAEADIAQAKTARWDAAGNAIAIAGCLLMLTTLVGVGLWTRRAVVRPMLSLSDAMERFGTGQLAARTTEHGAVEIERMAKQFNTMASRIERQRQESLAHLAGIAHDLRTPLAALALATDLDVAQRQVSRLNRMVGDLLETARIEAGQLSLTLQIHDVRTIVRTVADLFEGTSPAHTIRLDLPAEPLRVSCDAMRIEQTMNNLVSNAIKYSPHGGTITLAARRDGDVVKISVTDPGVGIAEQELAHLWEPFRRASSVRELIPGVGLGLSIAKKIIEAHDGTIRVVSTPGVGSTFTIELPAFAYNAPVAVLPFAKAR